MRLITACLTTTRLITARLITACLTTTRLITARLITAGLTNARLTNAGRPGGSPARQPEQWRHPVAC